MLIIGDLAKINLIQFMVILTKSNITKIWKILFNLLLWPKDTFSLDLRKTKEKKHISPIYIISKI